VDRLEEQLRSVLTDERLDVHPALGAVQAVHDGVRRRKRRNAALSVAASFVLVIGGVVAAVATTQGGHAVVEPGQHNPTPTSSPSHTDAPPVPGLRQDVVIPWNPITYDPTKPFPLAGTTPDSDVPWCGAGQLSVRPTEFQGATGSAAGGLTLTNDGNVCGIQGSPAITGYGDGDKVIATSEAGDPFLVHAWVALQHGERARTFVQMFADGSRCLGAVRRLGVDLGHGIAPVSVDLSGAGDTTPRCTTAPRDQQLDHYVVSAGDWTRTDGSPRLPMGDFSATIGQQPATVMQGTTIRYHVLLSTRGASVDPCLPYRQQLLSLDGTHTAIGTAYFLVDCHAIERAAAAQSYQLDMQLALPGNIPVGTYAIQWQTPIPGLGADESQTIRVTAAPTACKQDQLDFSIGGSAAATGHFEQDIVIRNLSAQACALRGYPGVEFANADGHAMRTKPHHGASYLWQTDSYETVRLAPAAMVSFALGGVDHAPGGTCPVATLVKVIAPGLVTQVPLEVNWPYCRGGSVDVSPVVPGIRGPR
jgi:uncharacterized protein DUF4232